MPIDTSVLNSGIAATEGQLKQLLRDMLVPIELISSGSVGVAATKSIISIAEEYSYLCLKLTGISCDTTTRQLLIRFSTDNGVSFNAVAANYPGVKRTGTTFTAKTLASIIESVTITNAQTFDVDLNIYGFQTGPNARFAARVVANAVEYEVSGTLLTVGANIDALQLLWDASGNFDGSSTYALYGIR